MTNSYHSASDANRPGYAPSETVSYDELCKLLDSFREIISVQPYSQAYSRVKAPHFSNRPELESLFQAIQQLEIAFGRLRMSSPDCGKICRGLAQLRDQATEKAQKNGLFTATDRTMRFAHGDISRGIRESVSAISGRITPPKRSLNLAQIAHLMSENPQNFIRQYLSPALSNRYTSIQFLKKGGMGIVLRAKNLQLSRWEVLKFNTFVHDPEERENAEQEAKSAAQIKHPNVVMIHGYETATIHGIPVPYHVYELIEGAMDGKDLIQRVNKGEEDFSNKEYLLLMQQAADGVAAVHEKGMLHRDLKPDNVLFERDSEGRIKTAKIGDLGIALNLTEKMMQSLSGESLNRQQADEIDPHKVFGTLPYIPPEKWARPEENDKPWDVYSLGIVFYELLTGHDHPYEYSIPDFEARKRSLNSYALYVGESKKGSAVSPKDPNMQYLPRPIRKLLIGMTAFNVEERLTITEVQEHIAEALNAIEAGHFTRRNVGIGLTGILAVGALAITNVWSSGEKKAQQSAEEKATEVMLSSIDRNTEALENLVSQGKWSEALSFCEVEEQRITASTDISAERKLTELTRLKAFRSVIRKAHKLAQQLSNTEDDYESIRKELKAIETDWKAAQAAFEGLSKQIDRQEVQTAFGKAQSAYATGDTEQALAALERIQALQSPGLTTEEKEQCSEMREQLKQWPSMQKTVSRKVAALVKTPSEERFSSALASCAEQKQPEDLLAMLIAHQQMYGRYLKRTHRKNFAKLVRQDPEVRKLHFRLMPLRATIGRMAANQTQMSRALPGMEKTYQVELHTIGQYYSKAILSIHDQLQKDDRQYANLYKYLIQRLQPLLMVERALTGSLEKANHLGTTSSLVLRDECRELLVKIWPLVISPKNPSLGPATPDQLLQKLPKDPEKWGADFLKTLETQVKGFIDSKRW